jgi:DNA-binding GntR family transcriptional regulator
MSERDELGPPTKADAAYLALRDRILQGSVRAGERIDQSVLAESLGVSTTPLREALRRLETEKLVIRSAHRDVTIAPLTLQDARQLFIVRMDLDVLAIRLAAIEMTAEELSVGRRLVSAKGTEFAERYLRRSGIAHQPAFATPRAFHHLIYSGSHNQVLIEILGGLWARTERYAYLVRGQHSDRSATNQKDHLEMLEAIKEHDVSRAEDLMRGHSAVEQAIESFLEAQQGQALT